MINLNYTSNAALGSDQSYSICSNTSLDLTSLYNTAGFNTNWTLNNFPVANPVAISNPGIYILIASSSGGCADTAQVTVNNLLTPALGANQIISICLGNSIDLTSLYTTTGFSTAWTLSGAPVANPTSVNNSGTYTLIANSVNNCSDTADVDLYILNAITLGADQSQNICSNSEINLNSLYNTTGLTASWTINGSPVADPSSVSNAGTFVLIATAAGGCSDTAQVIITILPAPALGVNQSTTTCPNSNVDLTGFFNTSGLNSSWTINGNVVPDPTTINVTGSYQLVATNLQNCSDTALVNVIINALPFLGPNQSISICRGSTADLSNLYNTTGFDVVYSFNNIPITNYTSVADSGIYIITVTDVNGCTNEATVVLTLLPCLCVADFTYDGKCVQDPVSFSLVADSTILSAEWTFSNNVLPVQNVINPVVYFPDEEAVLVTLEARLSCGNVIVEKYVRVEDCSGACNFYLPAAFTPNNDGVNDELKTFSNCEPENYELNIHNRFGQLIYHSNNPNDSWDGKYEDRFLPAAVYVLHVEYKLPYQNKQKRITTITIIR